MESSRTWYVSRIDCFEWIDGNGFVWIANGQGDVCVERSSEGGVLVRYRRLDSVRCYQCQYVVPGMGHQLCGGDGRGIPCQQRDGGLFPADP